MGTVQTTWGTYQETTPVLIAIESGAEPQSRRVLEKVGVSTEYGIVVRLYYQTSDQDLLILPLNSILKFLFQADGADDWEFMVEEEVLFPKHIG